VGDPSQSENKQERRGCTGYRAERGCQAATEHADMLSPAEQELWWWESGGSAAEPGDVQVVEGDEFFVPEDVMSSAKQDEVPQPIKMIPRLPKTRLRPRRAYNSRQPMSLLR
jgi:hypothetical protein